MNNSTLSQLWTQMHNAIAIGQFGVAMQLYSDLSNRVAQLPKSDQDRVVWYSIKATYASDITNHRNEGYSVQ